MNRLTTLLFLVFAFNITYAQIPTAGLVAHWPFSGNANDAGPNGNHGNTNNVTLTTGKLGLPNSAYLFNSSSSYIGVPYKANLNVGTAITMCAVFRPTGFYPGTCQGNYIFTRGQQGTTGSYELHYTDNPYNSCSQHDTNLYVMGTNTGNNLPANQSVWQSASKIHTGTWYCVVATMSGGTLNVYVNGVLSHTSNGWNIGSSTDSICIGKQPWGGPSFPYNFTGVIDDIAIYNRALTTAGIDSYCNAFNSIDTTVYISQPLNKTAFCPAETVHLRYKVTFPFRPNNLFTAQLSNSSGSFANPVNIGSLAYNNDSVIICTIPPGTSAGTGYRVRIVGSAPGDTSTDNGVNLTVHPVPTPVINSNSPVCVGDTIQLSATYTGGTFSWSGPGGFSAGGASVTRPNATNPMAGTYIVITTANGCKDTSSATVSVESGPVISITAIDSLCALDTLQLLMNAVPPASTYSWKGPLSSVNAQQWTIPNVQSVHSGWYIATATSLNGCSSKDSVKIHITDFTINLGDSFLLCNLTNRLTLNIPGATYLWQDGSTGNEYHITQSGTYYVTVNQNGCIKSDTTSGKVVTIDVNLGEDTTLCLGDEHLLVVADTFDSYVWDNGDTTRNMNIIKAGSYSLVVTKEKCTATDVIKVDYVDPRFDLGNNIVVCRGEQITLTAESLPGSTYIWNNGQTGPVTKVEKEGLYVVTAQNICGIFWDTINVAIEECDCRPYIANVFSPNNDGNNDKIGPKIFCATSHYKFIIANRWGNIVFNTTNPLEKWDGTYKGREAGMDTYFYYYEITGPDGKEYSGRGDILLIR